MVDANTLEQHEHSSGSLPANLHSAFKWHCSEHIPSLNIVMEKYVHKITGAVHYHLASKNTENVFLVAFRTVPGDSSGVAHILEHTALCGSEKYPVRDPFFMMIRRSLNTFMNAFTSSDWTAYPFASKNRKDFNNLLSVYLDAAFFSRLHKLDFAQEGHRLEFAEPNNPSSELLYKGVVYNEMKGAMSSTNSVLWQTMSKHLFPTTTYHYNSGGEPEHIPELSYEDLINFYKTHYHPSNAVFMTYGDIPANEHHLVFEELALSRFEQLDVNIEVKDEKRYLAPIKVEETYASDSSNPDKCHIVLGWLLGNSTDLSELFRYQLLSSVLLDNSSSPLLKALETSKLGNAPSHMCGLEDSNREASFMAGLQGCASAASAEVEALVLDTLKSVVAGDLTQELVEAALHQLELNQREISGDSYPYGLQLILTGLSTAVHRGDPIKLLNIEPVLAELRDAIKDIEFIPNLIKELLLDNTHRVLLTLKPDPKLDERKINAEKQKLKNIKAALSASSIDQIIEQTQALANRQSQHDDPDVLPKVTLADVPAKIMEPSRESDHLAKSNAPLSYYGQGTNGLSYQQVVVDLPKLNSEFTNILPLYTSCLTEFGIGQNSYEEVQAWQAQVSGGISCFSSIRSGQDDVQQTKAFLTISSKSLASNHKEMSSLLFKTISAVRFDEEKRLNELLEQLYTSKMASITGQGHSLAMILASSKMGANAHLTHCFGGLEGIRRLKKLRDKLQSETTIAHLLTQFAELHEMICNAPRQFLLIGEPELKNSLIADINKTWSDWECPKQGSVFSLTPIRNRVLEAWTTSTQVNFCAKAYPTVPASHEDNAVLHVLAGFMRNGYLHRAIREQGGAYGGGAGQDANSASFRFFSYRDPRINETLDDFDRALEWAVSGKHQNYQLEEAILGVIAIMDKPSSPAGEAKQSFYNNLFGRTLDQRIKFRQRVLATTLDDLRGVASQYFDPVKSSIGVITNKETVGSLTNSDIEIINL
ncbi:MAG: insulinase family protein [Pseudomonadota bacterium]|nr:insulinase family protein [Pseudomonadota bacterium]